MSTDSQLQQAVLAELSWEPSVDAAYIGVAVHAGIVTLTGHVDSFAAKHAAAAAAGRVRGVKGVAEEITIRLLPETERGDEEIAAAALERLAWDVAVPRDAVKVTAEKGWITLTGEVDRYYQRDAAEQDIHRLVGVTGVSNLITIKPVVDAGNLSDDIMHALHRSWFFDPHTITVTVDGKKVRLSGTAQSPHDRRVAAETAWAAPGVSEVENDIVVV
jgi:osmotically-inducible protein OsmY